MKLSLNIEKRLVETCVRIVALYGCETRLMSYTERKILEVVLKMRVED